MTSPASPREFLLNPPSPPAAEQKDIGFGDIGAKIGAKWKNRTQAEVADGDAKFAGMMAEAQKTQASSPRAEAGQCVEVARRTSDAVMFDVQVVPNVVMRMTVSGLEGAVDALLAAAEDAGVFVPGAGGYDMTPSCITSGDLSWIRKGDTVEWRDHFQLDPTTDEPLVGYTIRSIPVAWARRILREMAAAL